MLILRRNAGQWTEIIHAASGDVLRVRLCEVEDNQAQLGFVDNDRHFEIERPERKHAARPPLEHLKG